MIGIRSFVFAVLLSVASSATAAESPICTHNSTAAAAAVYLAISQQDGDGLAALIHPIQGVRVSPAAFIDPELDPILKPDEVAALWTDETVRTWGYAEGTGEPITMTGAEYLAAYLPIDSFDTFSASFDRATVQSGGTVNNAPEIYTDAAVVEFRHEGVDEPETNWTALRMVFILDKDDCKRLIGLISDRWSP